MGPPPVLSALRSSPALRNRTELDLIHFRLRTVPFYETQSPSNQLLLCRIAEVAEFDAREVVARQGQEATTFYLILTGQVKVYRNDAFPKLPLLPYVAAPPHITPLHTSPDLFNSAETSAVIDSSSGGTGGARSAQPGPGSSIKFQSAQPDAAGIASQAAGPASIGVTASATGGASVCRRFLEDESASFGHLVGLQGEGDYFGEAALLGSVRTWPTTVVAAMAVLALKIQRVECEGMLDRAVQVLRLSSSERNEEDIASLAALLATFRFFQQLTSATCIYMARFVGYSKVKADTPVVVEGDDGDSMFAVVTGRCAVYKRSISDGRTNPTEGSPYGMQVCRLWPGDTFGEQALLLAASPSRQATVIALQTTELIIIERSLFERTIKAAAVGGTILFRPEATREALRLPPTDRSEHDIARITELIRPLAFFREKSSNFISRLAQVLTSVNYQAGDTVFEQGQAATYFYIILSGSCNVFVREDSSGSGLCRGQTLHRSLTVDIPELKEDDRERQANNSESANTARKQESCSIPTGAGLAIRRRKATTRWDLEGSSGENLAAGNEEPPHTESAGMSTAVGPGLCSDVNGGVGAERRSSRAGTAISRQSTPGRANGGGRGGISRVAGAGELGLHWRTRSKKTELGHNSQRDRGPVSAPASPIANAVIKGGGPGTGTPWAKTTLRLIADALPHNTRAAEDERDRSGPRKDSRGRIDSEPAHMDLVAGIARRGSMLLGGGATSCPSDFYGMLAEKTHGTTCREAERDNGGKTGGRVGVGKEQRLGCTLSRPGSKRNLSSTRSAGDGGSSVVVTRWGRLVRVLRVGDSFGELGLLAGEGGNRAATVVAAQPLELLCIGKSAYADTLKAIHMAEMNENLTFLRSASIFRLSTTAELRVVLLALKQRVVAKGTVVLWQGKASDSLYLVRHGEVRICHWFDKQPTTELYRPTTPLPFRNRRTRQAVDVAVLGPAQFFGESCFTGEPSHVDVVATLPTRLLMLPRQEFGCLTGHVRTEISKLSAARASWQSSLEARSVAVRGWLYPPTSTAESLEWPLWAKDLPAGGGSTHIRVAPSSIGPGLDDGPSSRKPPQSVHKSTAKMTTVNRNQLPKSQAATDGSWANGGFGINFEPASALSSVNVIGSSRLTNGRSDRGYGIPQERRPPGVDDRTQSRNRWQFGSTEVTLEGTHHETIGRSEVCGTGYCSPSQPNRYVAMGDVDVVSGIDLAPAVLAGSVVRDFAGPDSEEGSSVAGDSEGEGIRAAGFAKRDATEGDKMERRVRDGMDTGLNGGGRSTVELSEQMGTGGPIARLGCSRTGEPLIEISVCRPVTPSGVGLGIRHLAHCRVRLDEAELWEHSMVGGRLDMIPSHMTFPWKPKAAEGSMAEMRTIRKTGVKEQPLSETTPGRDELRENEGWLFDDPCLGMTRSNGFSGACRAANNAGLKAVNRLVAVDAEPSRTRLRYGRLQCNLHVTLASALLKVNDASWALRVNPKVCNATCPVKAGRTSRRIRSPTVASPPTVMASKSLASLRLRQEECGWEQLRVHLVRRHDLSRSTKGSDPRTQRPALSLGVKGRSGSCSNTFETEKTERQSRVPNGRPGRPQCCGSGFTTNEGGK